MSYWDEDWYEPSEFDIMMDEFKESIKSNARQEIKDEIAGLKNELATLKEVKENWKKIEQENSRLKLEVQRIKEDAERNANKAKLDDLLKDCPFVAYCIDCSFEYVQEKCDKCDNTRQIHFTSPSGKDYKELCSCAQKKMIYSPREIQLYGLQVPFNSNQQKVKPIYICEKNSDNSYSLTNCVDDMDFKRVEDIWRPFFKDYGRAVEYCEWKNQKG